MPTSCTRDSRYVLSWTTAVPLQCYWKVREKKFLKIKTTREVKFIVFYMSREFSGVSVEFGFVGDFLFPNGSLLWGCHFWSSLALN